LKKKKQQLKAKQNTLNDRWIKVLAAEEGYDYERQTKSYPKRKLLPQFDNEALEPAPPRYTQADQPDRPLEDGTGRMERPNTHPFLLAEEARIQCNQNTNTTYDSTWMLEQVRQDPSTDPKDTLPLDGMNTKLGSTKTIELGSSTRPG
jgi:hypothetical protein